MYDREQFSEAGVGLWPVAGGSFRGRGDMQDRRFVAPHLTLAVTLDGRMRERTAQGEFVTRRGQVVCLWPMEEHYCSEVDGRPARNYFFHIDGPAAVKTVAWLGVTPADRVRTPADSAAVQDWFKEIVEALKASALFSPLHFLRAYYALLESCAGPDEISARADEESLAERARRLCRISPVDTLTVARLARSLDVCQNTLNKACRRELGCSPVRLLIATKLEKARQLLNSGNYSIAHIARACGFASASRFNVCFKTEVGLTPGAYREDCLRQAGEN